MKRVTLIICMVLLSLCAYSQSRFLSSLPCEKKTGYNVYGVVECEGQPLKGVQVSDGYDIVITDEKGCYYLNSEKRNGNIFVTSPSGYDYVCGRGGMQEFWAKLSREEKSPERHDFRLIVRDQQKYLLLGLSDMHLCKPYGLERFKDVVLPDIRKTLKRYRGVPQYTLNGGDTSFDKFWYEFNFKVGDARRFFEQVEYPTPMFVAMGNHDHDSAVAASPDTFFRAEEPFRETFGPTYYSFNIGSFHYIIFDNIYYKNTKVNKVAVGAAGKRDYLHYVTQNQIDWIKKDLSYVDKSTPVIICSHCPLLFYKGLSTNKIISKFADENNLRSFLNLFRDYETHMISGHTHRRATVRLDSMNFTEHNLTCILTHRWEKAIDIDSKRHFSGECSPVGYEVIEVDGRNLRFTFHSVADGEKKQFRVWDLNSVRDYCRKSERYEDFISHYKGTWTDFRTLEDNQILVNVWAWNPKWKVEILEDGVQLDVKRKRFESPQYVFYDDVHYTTDRNHYGKGHSHNTSANMFFAKCSKDKSKITVRVTDEYGRVYVERFSRPKRFTPDAM